VSARTFIPCSIPECDGHLHYVKETRDHDADVSSRLAKIVAGEMPNASYVFRTRACTKCDALTPTVEVAFFCNGRPVVSVQQENKHTRKVVERPAPVISLGTLASGEQCANCFSWNTQRNGTCITCCDCYWSGECG